MLVIPMKDHKEVVIGVLQLINRKRDFEAVLAAPADVERQVVPFSRRTVELVTALAGQAAVAIENSQLYAEIENLFKGFVNAAVTAIEQRDPTTFGHSGHVAGMTVGLAKVVDRSPDGPYRTVHFTREQTREIEYAGLLHDFGKVGVREQVLVKAKKLYPHDLALIKQRCAFVRRTAEREFWRKRALFLEERGAKGYEAFLKTLEDEQARELGELDRFLATVVQANEPTVLPTGRFEDLKRVTGLRCDDVDGRSAGARPRNHGQRSAGRPARPAPVPAVRGSQGVRERRGASRYQSRNFTETSSRRPPNARRSATAGSAPASLAPSNGPTNRR